MADGVEPYLEVEEEGVEACLGKAKGAELYLGVEVEEVEVLMHLVLKVSGNLKQQEVVVVRGEGFPVFFGSYRYWAIPLVKCHLIWEHVIGLIKALEV